MVSDERESPYQLQLDRWAADRRTQPVPEHFWPSPVTLGIEWFKEFEEKENMTSAPTTQMIQTGSLVTVEVHGLPDDEVKSFTYRTTYPVGVGQQVLVPAPDWSIRVTGREELPGFVLGLTDSFGLTDIPIRNIIPESAVRADGDVRALAERWEEEARNYESLVEYHWHEADLAQQRATDLRTRLAELQHAAGLS